MASKAFSDDTQVLNDDSSSPLEIDHHIKDYLYKMNHFDDRHLHL